MPEGETAFSYLYQLAHDGLLRRYQPVTKRALSQLAHELDVIDRTNLAEFFLIVWDLMEFARTNGIIGQGRGSAGDSIVAYCLGITKVDPIEHKLLFERFINEARALPDIDIDFDVNRREEVIQYLYTKYGADHAAMVCTIVTYRARSAVREVAKALGFPLEGIDALAKALDTRDATDVARDLALDGSFAWLFDELGIEMADAAVPPGRDGRGTGIVHRQADSSWNPRPRPAIDLQPQADQPRLLDAGQEAAGARSGSRPVSEGGWYPPKRARVLDASVTTVRHESETTKRYARSGELAGGELRAADAARQRLARPVERAAAPRADRPGERDADRGASPATGRAGGTATRTVMLRRQPALSADRSAASELRHRFGQDPESEHPTIVRLASARDRVRGDAPMPLPTTPPGTDGSGCCSCAPRSTASRATSASTSAACWSPAPRSSTSSRSSAPPCRTGSSPSTTRRTSSSSAW